MPSQYAHLRFGTGVIPRMPPQVQRVIRQFRPLYEVGLHGPDIFLFHNFFFRDKVVTLGKTYHGFTGEEFFLSVCKRLGPEPSEAVLAYLYGVLTHYCLDSAMHPFVQETVKDGQLGHTELETEFDRCLLQLDGRRQPNTFDCSPHIRLTGGECETVAGFYGISPGAVQASVRRMAAGVRFLAMPNNNFRRFAENAAGGRLRQHFMGRTPNKKCAPCLEPMLACYNRALEELPGMMDALLAHLSHNAPLGERFTATFNG